MSMLTPQQRRSIWKERLTRFRSTQLTVAEFCQREGVSAPSFYAWKKRLAPEHDDALPVERAMTTPSKFVPLVITAAQLPSRMMLPGGATIELPIEQRPEQAVQLMIAAMKATELHRANGDNA